jgi:plastocyanin
MTRRTAAVGAALCLVGVCAVAFRLDAEAAARKPVTHTVTVDAAQFSPAELSVKVGDSIVWVNKDIVAHTATTVKSGFDSKMIEPGKSWRHTVKRKGEFPYICSFHPLMKAVLRVK